MHTHIYIHTSLRKRKFLPLGRNTTIYWYILVDTHLESSLNMRQKCALVAKKVNGTLGCVSETTCCQQAGEGDHFSTQPWQDQSWISCPVLSSSEQNTHGTTGENSVKGLQRCLRDRSTSPMREGCESWDCLDRRRESSGAISFMCVNA